MIRNLMLAVLAASILVMPAVSRAEEGPIAVVDIQRLLTGSKAGLNIQQQLEMHKSKFLADIKEQELKLRDDEKALAAQRESMPPEEFAKKAKEFEEKLPEKRRVAQERKQAIENAANKAVTQLRNEILKIVQAISDEKGYSLVINKQNVVINSKGMDITEETLARLDKNLSQIALEISDK